MKHILGISSVASEFTSKTVRPLEVEGEKCGSSCGAPKRHVAFGRVSGDKIHPFFLVVSLQKYHRDGVFYE